MRARILFLALLAFSVSALAENGKEAAKLKQALASIGGGECPSAVLSPMIKYACDNQPQTKSTISSLGPVQATEFLGIQAMPNGEKAEAYKVTFERGLMMWIVNSGPDGKFSTFWSDGSVQPR